jgi:hypothetical protein
MGLKKVLGKKVTKHLHPVIHTFAEIETWEKFTDKEIADIITALIEKVNAGAPPGYKQFSFDHDETTSTMKLKFYLKYTGE